MRFAKIVFWVAGIWGLAVLVPLYFFYDFIGKQDPPPLTHPQFYYGFVGVALVWQVAFLMIASNPVRFRPFMIVSVLEKASFVLMLIALSLQVRLAWTQTIIGLPDAILGVLFAVSFWKVGQERART
ncbi:MAG TPA: hypothetical protein VJQ82_18730 [Terriglobales bacterium]|nr:hypothetical protein [Terriglobales bacterium]